MRKSIAVAVAIAALILVAQVGATEECISCHEKQTPGLVNDYKQGKHSDAGVGCLDCHEGVAGDPSIRDHNGFDVTPVVSPKKCGECHPTQLKQFRDSLHDEAGLFALSAYATVGDVKVEGSVTKAQNKNYKTNFARESAEQGCLDCHGTVIKVAEDGTLINWPNVGMGRFNPDGSTGSCATCHPRHRFSVEMARKSETCGQCHMGPDHPQIEIWTESKHGNIFNSYGEEMDWSGGADGKLDPSDVQTPTCAVCHMSDFGTGMGSTHDVSSRLKWELEPAWSWPTEPKYWSGSEKYPIDPDIAARYEKIYDLPAGSLKEVATGAPNPFAIAKKFAPEVYEAYVGPGKWWSKGETRADAYSGDSLKSPDEKRKAMLKICQKCHSRAWAKGDLDKADKVIDVYNAVALAIKKKYYDPIKAEKLDEDVKFNGKSEADNLWHEIWHHEGRIWRMGSFMQAQDWQHWEGAYEVADDGSHLADWLLKLRARKSLKEAEEKIKVAEDRAAKAEATAKALESKLKQLESKIGVATSSQPAAKGICGPTAVVAIALTVVVLLTAIATYIRKR
jgi:cytochrome c553